MKKRLLEIVQSILCKSLIISCLVPTLLGGANSCSPQNTLFEDGESSYTIVLDSQATEIERYAALELQTWLEQVSGVRIPITAEAPAGNRLILETEDRQGREDSFVYFTEGADIHFRGNGPRGTLYAVYAFLVFAES